MTLTPTTISKFGWNTFVAGTVAAQLPVVQALQPTGVQNAFVLEGRGAIDVSSSGVRAREVDFVRSNGTPAASSTAAHGAGILAATETPAVETVDLVRSLSRTLLRPYQNEAVDRLVNHLSQHDRGLVVLPTGTGKTEIFLHTILRLANEFPASLKQNITVVCHLENLETELTRRLQRFFGSEYVGGYGSGAPIVMTTVQTLLQRGVSPEDAAGTGFLILDEAHHYVPGNEWFATLEHILSNENIKVAGFTATPDRADGVSLRDVYGPHGLVYTRGINFFLDQKFLLPIRCSRYVLRAEDDENRQTLWQKEVWDRMTNLQRANMMEEIIANHLRKPDGSFLSAAFFGNRIEEVSRLAEELATRGYRAKAVTSETAESAEILNAHKRGEIDFVFVVEKIGEGYDNINLEAAVLLFETDSRRKTVQIVGRVLRPNGIKNHALIVDLGDNLARHQLSVLTEEIYESDGVSRAQKREELDEGKQRELQDREGDARGIEYTWMEYSLRINREENVFCDVLKTVIHDESDVDYLAYESGISSDEIYNWWHGISIPRSVEAVERVARVLESPEFTLELKSSYEATVNGVRKHFAKDVLWEAKAALEADGKNLTNGNYIEWARAQTPRRPASSTIARCLTGSEKNWTGALRAAGIEPVFEQYKGELTQSEAIAILHEAKATLEAEGKSLTGDNYKDWARAQTPRKPSWQTIALCLTGDKSDWNGALRAAGLEPVHTQGELTQAEAIAILQEAKAALGVTGKNLIVENYKSWARAQTPHKPAWQTIARCLTGSEKNWSGALRAAGIEPVFEQYKGELTQAEAIEILLETKAALEAEGKSLTGENYKVWARAQTPRRPASSTIARCLTGDKDDWTGALRAAGLEPVQVKGELTQTEAIANLQEAKVALESLGMNLSAVNYCDWARNQSPRKPSRSTIVKCLVGNSSDWNGALRAAGIEPVHVQGELTREVAIALLHEAKTALGSTAMNISKNNYNVWARGQSPRKPVSETISVCLTGDANDWNSALRAAELEPVQLRGELTKQAAIVILYEAQTALAAERKDLSTANYNAWAKAQMPCKPVWRTIARCLTGDQNDWNEALLTAGIEPIHVKRKI